MAGDVVHLRIQDAIQTAELLEQLTVSLDRIGSRDADGEDGANLLWAFVVDGDVDDLPGTFVVEVGVRQAWPFVGLCDSRSARSHEFRLYVDAPWSIGGTHAADPSQTFVWLEASCGLTGLGVDSASVDADGTLQVRFADSSALSISGVATEDTAGEPWWLSPAKQA